MRLLLTVYSVQSYENECGWHSLVKSDEKFLSSYWDLSLLIDYLGKCFQKHQMLYMLVNFIGQC